MIKEETKQTVEEAAKEYYERYKIHLSKDIFRPRIIDVFKSGAEWQKEQMIEALSSKTVEEAAMDFANYESNNLDKLPFKVKNVVDYDNGLTRGFKAGAEWQAKQSPWISVKDKAGCDTSGDCIVMVVNGDIFKAYFSSENKWMKSNGGYYDEVIDDVVAWFPIPSFDEILEVNKDVLERIKERG